jgi:hypothetical protein
MFELLIGVGIGLVIGWNVLPQPSWVQKLYSRWFEEGR